MKFHSTNNRAKSFTFKEILLMGLAPDGGLFMPDRIPKMPRKFFDNLMNYSFHQIAKAASAKFIISLPKAKLSSIIKEAFDFSIPLIKLQKNLYILELFHGPTMAFKDFGARFMARTMAHFLKKQKRKLNIVVATSGDTGSAVASGFYNIPNIRVFILYPSGKVSPLQEKQLTTYGGNVKAVEVKGTFDDCQRLAKAILSEFAHHPLRSAATPPQAGGKINVSSANSINFGRLLPQSFYYFWAVGQLRAKFKIKTAPVIVVPSGNFGNLTAGLLAKKMGLPVAQFIAATNINRVVPIYLESGKFVPRKSQKTISNAMDVGNPSNFVRMQELYQHNYRLMNQEVAGISINDKETRNTIKNIYENTGFILDPHTAVGVAAAVKSGLNRPTVVLATAHPSKFAEVVEPVIERKLDFPSQLTRALKKSKKSTIIKNDLKAFKEVMFHNAAV